MKEITDTGIFSSDTCKPPTGNTTMNPHPETPEPNDAANQPNFGPEANALKHGYCATKIVDPELKSRAEVILEKLRETHEPWSPEEHEAVEELAQVQARLERLETAMDTKVVDEKARAAELYERKTLDAFHADLAKFRENPALHGPILARTWQGADWLQKLWTRVETELKPDANPVNHESHINCLPFQVAIDAAAALGGNWQVDQADGDAAWLMARHVRITPEPEESLTVWIKNSNSQDGPKTTLARARKLLSKAPADPAQARAEIVEKAIAEKHRWALCANQLRTNYETALARAAESAVGTGSGDPALEKEFRLLARYLTTARNRADRLKRRLDNLKKDRKRDAWRAQQKAEREARRLKKESDAIRKQVDDELARADAFTPATASRSAYPAYGGYSANSRKPESRTCSVGSVDTPAISKSDSKPAQDVVIARDKRNLRNGIADLEAELDHELEQLSGPIDEDEVLDPAFETSRRELLAIPREERTFKDRCKRIRYRNWADSTEVMADEANFLRKLMAMPDSIERSFSIRVMFGEPDVFLRCWSRYSSWAETKLVAEAEASFRRSVMG